LRKQLQQVKLLRSRAHLLCTGPDLCRSRDGELLRTGPDLRRSGRELLQQVELLQEQVPPDEVLQEQVPQELLRAGPKLLRSGCADLRRSSRADLRRSSRCVLQLVDPVNFRVLVSLETGTRLCGVQPARRGSL
jgi:hypothetical protein